MRNVAARMQVAEVIAARTDNELVGTATFCAAGTLGSIWPNDWAVLRALAVNPTRRAGVAGRALVTACIDHARAAGTSALALHTAAFMTSAVDLYERCRSRRDPSLDITPGAIPMSTTVMTLRSDEDDVMQEGEHEDGPQAVSELVSERLATARHLAGAFGGHDQLGEVADVSDEAQQSRKRR